MKSKLTQIEAAEEQERQRRRSEAIERLLELRRQQPPFSDAEISRARRADRP